MTIETVIVASKLPNGLICRIFRPQQEFDQILGGGVREVTRYYPTGEQFVLNGTAGEAGKNVRARLENGMPDASRSAEMLDTGFALTFNVPKDLWDVWLEQNKGADYVKNGLVFAHRQLASVKKQAKENEARRSGFEAIDPENPGGDVEPTDEQKKRLVGNRLKSAA